jgi:hypothetical protein
MNLYSLSHFELQFGGGIHILVLLSIPPLFIILSACTTVDKAQTGIKKENVLFLSYRDLYQKAPLPTKLHSTEEKTKGKGMYLRDSEYRIGIFMKA